MQSTSRAIPSFARICARSCYRRPLQTTSLFNRLQPQRLPVVHQTLRHNSSTADVTSHITAAKPHRPAPHRDPNTPVYELTFTCKACMERSSHTVSKQGYHKGTTIIKCPKCKTLHLISDHLRIFTDKSTTLEDLLREKGESLRKGSIDAEGDIEYWADERAAEEETPSDRPPKAIGSS